MYDPNIAVQCKQRCTLPEVQQGIAFLPQNHPRCFHHDNPRCYQTLLQTKLKKIFPIFLGGVAYWAFGSELLIQVYTTHVLLILDHSVWTIKLKYFSFIFPSDLSMLSRIGVVTYNNDLFFIHPHGCNNIPMLALFILPSCHATGKVLWQPTPVFPSCSAVVHIIVLQVLDK